jgi:hypothetical protein
VELTLLVEEVVPLEPASEAVERLAGLSDPEPHRVHHLPQARHLPGGDDDDDDREQERRRRSSAALLLGSRGLGRSREGGEPEPAEQRCWGTGPACALGFPEPFWNDHFTHLVRSAVMSKLVCFGLLRFTACGSQLGMIRRTKGPTTQFWSIIN